MDGFGGVPNSVGSDSVFARTDMTTETNEAEDGVDNDTSNETQLLNPGRIMRPSSLTPNALHGMNPDGTFKTGFFGSFGTYKKF